MCRTWNRSQNQHEHRHKRSSHAGAVMYILMTTRSSHSSGLRCSARLSGHRFFSSLLHPTRLCGVQIHQESVLTPRLSEHGAARSTIPYFRSLLAQLRSSHVHAPLDQFLPVMSGDPPLSSCTLNSPCGSARRVLMSRIASSSNSHNGGTRTTTPVQHAGSHAWYCGLRTAMLGLRNTQNRDCDREAEWCTCTGRSCCGRLEHHCMACYGHAR
jgi:hypothetical protein